MALLKPSWLSTALNWLNWDIFGWKVYVGGTIETLVYWILSGVNWAIDGLAAVWAYFTTFWDSMLDWVNARLTTVWEWFGSWYDTIKEWVLTLISPIWNWLTHLSNTIDTWWSALGDWWAGIYQTVEDWVASQIQEVKDFFQPVVDVVNWLVDFHQTLWDLTTLAWNTAVAAKALVEQLQIDWGDLFKWWGEFSGDVSEFFADPLEWVYNRVDEFFDRHW